MLKSFRHTFVACSVGYVTQAIVNNFLPLLFVFFIGEFQFTLERLTLISTMNFFVQLFVDTLATKFIDKIGYRRATVLAHAFTVLGLSGLAWLPYVLSPLAGLLVCVLFDAIGGGMLEVVVSPIVEACPAENKTARMSLLHSFYCWGSAGVILLSTGAFFLFGQENWRIFALCWAFLPLLNGLYFLFVPIKPLTEEGRGMKLRDLFRSKILWCFLLIMFGAGASELAMAQWASAFAESGLGVSKAIGDLLGPFLFAVAMGTTRVLFARFGKKRKITTALALSATLCIGSYLIASLSPISVLSFLGCGLCGVSVAIMWPGTYSYASEKLPNGGTSLFALLALAGDLGCTMGPSIVGWTAGAFGALQDGLLFAIVFPAVILIALFLLRKPKQKTLKIEK